MLDLIENRKVWFQYGKINGENRSAGKGKRFCLSGLGNLRRPCQYMGLRQSGRGIEEQCKESLVAEIRAGESL